MTFTITGPGEYRTRDGRKMHIGGGLGFDGEMLSGYDAKWNIYRLYESSGKCLGPSTSDIIGPWEEPQPKAVITPEILSTPSSPHETATHAALKQLVTPPRGLVEDLTNALVSLLGRDPDADATARRVIAKAEAYLEANPTDALGTKPPTPTPLTPYGEAVLMVGRLSRALRVAETNLFNQGAPHLAEDTGLMAAAGEEWLEANP